MGNKKRGRIDEDKRNRNKGQLWGTERGRTDDEIRNRKKGQ